MTGDATSGRSAGSLRERGWQVLLATTAATAGAYVWLAWLSRFHTLATPGVERPILLVIGVYAAAFVLYGIAWRAATGLRDTPRLLAWLLGASLLWRSILLPTAPFQEIDIYRYLWDGAVARHGWDPYEYSPKAAVEAIDRSRGGDAGGSERLDAMVRFATQTAPEYETVLRTIHFAELPSPYPPVSQAVFAAASATSPMSTATGHLAWLKGWLTAFDFATLLLVVWLLRLTGRHAGHAVAYGWCPLVMKEIAGSGHLDSIATFFAVFAVALTVRALPRGDGGSAKHGATLAVASAAALALGIGAKLFPVVLAPLLLIVWFRKIGWRTALAGAATMTAVSGLVLAPMLAPAPPVEVRPQEAATDGVDGATALPPPPLAAATDKPAGKTAGLAAFLSRWEINDLLFAAVVENLRSQEAIPPSKRPWFSVVPGETAAGATRAFQSTLGEFWPGALELSPQTASFLLARLITLAAAGAVALGCAWRASRPDASADDLPRAAFLTLAWFWLLAPTQNPWYWCWALPLIPFARGRAWTLVAGCSLLYYLRFWLLYHCPEPGVFGTPYDGAYYFYFVVSWIEFGPWLLLLIGETLPRLVRRRALETTNA